MVPVLVLQFEFALIPVPTQKVADFPSGEIKGDLTGDLLQSFCSDNVDWEKSIK